MKLFRAQCEECGIFELGNQTNPEEIIYVRYAPLPRAVVECPSCLELVLSPIDKATAELFEVSGTKVTKWQDREITEDEIQNFLGNLHDEIRLLIE